MIDQNPDISRRKDTGRTQTNDTQFVAVAPLYDALMNGVPYADWVTYLGKLLEQRSSRPRRILDLACGTGNVSELLADAGYSVTGVDIAPGMIEAARLKGASRAEPVEYLVQDAAVLDLPGKRFDLCVSFFDSLNYITDPVRLEMAIERIAAHLTHNGLFIFDINSEFALINQFFDQNNLGSGDRLRYDWRSDYDAKTRLCRVRMRFWHREEDGTDRAFEEIHWQFAYRTEEIIAMLEGAGFENIATYQAYSFRSPSRTADRIFFVARKP